MLARNALAARQWEAYYFDAGGGDRSASITPAPYSYRAWLADAWRQTLADDDARVVLTARQSRALWRTVIEASPAAARLLEVRHAARWAAQAHRLLADAALGAADVENADASSDARTFLAWQRTYLARLTDSGWLDESSLPSEIARRCDLKALVLLDFGELTKAESVFLRMLTSRGCEIEARTPPPQDCAAKQIGLRDSGEELESAVEWASTRLRAHPRTRLALVVPDLALEPGLVLQRVRRSLAASFSGAVTEFPAVGSARGLAPAASPAIGAALCAVELSSSRATFATLSRWLRSPFFGGNEEQAQSGAAAVEALLRNDLSAELPFLTAYDRGGLAGRLATLAPDLAAKLRAGLEVLRAEPPSATPDVWARALSRGLASLGWAAAGSGVDAASLDAWEKLLAAFAELTPILGACSQETAIELLRATAETELNAALPLHGIHVLARADDVGPGYDAVWVTGTTDRNWPEPTRLNPLLPPQLQIRHGMPWSTPADSLARARATLARLRTRTRELVLSWPRLVHDYQALPSPLLAGIPTADASDFRPRPRASVARRTLVSIPDPAPAFASARIPGGARTLDLQARCPIRAFCETRLAARPLPTVAQGLSPRTQGIAAHRALELLFNQQRSTETLGAAPPLTSDAIAASARRALTEVFGATRATLAVLFELESARLEQMLARLVEAELRRPPFHIVGVEQRTDIRVNDRTIACRLDRLDELADGTLALIDYKTGASRTKSQWLDDRLGSTQLPLYALEMGPRLSALFTIELSGQTTAYRGAARQPSLTADSLRVVPDAETWMTLLEGWRAQIRALVADYVGGDVRLYAEDWVEAAGDYAPLTRVHAHALRQTGSES